MDCASRQISCAKKLFDCKQTQTVHTPHTDTHGHAFVLSFKASPIIFSFFVFGDLFCVEIPDCRRPAIAIASSTVEGARNNTNTRDDSVSCDVKFTKKYFIQSLIISLLICSRAFPPIFFSFFFSRFLPTFLESFVFIYNVNVSLSAYVFVCGSVREPVSVCLGVCESARVLVQLFEQLVSSAGRSLM